MQVFQSFADVIIMFVLSIAYIITYVAQRNQIRALRGIATAHSELTSSQSEHISAFKKLLDLSDIEAAIKTKVDYAVLQARMESNDLEKKHELFVKKYNILMDSSINIIGYIYFLYTEKFGVMPEEIDGILRVNFSGDTYKIIKATFKVLDVHIAESKNIQIQ